MEEYDAFIQGSLDGFNAVLSAWFGQPRFNPEIIIDRQVQIATDFGTICSRLGDLALIGDVIDIDIGEQPGYNWDCFRRVIPKKPELYIAWYECGVNDPEQFPEGEHEKGSSCYLKITPARLVTCLDRRPELSCVALETEASAPVTQQEKPIETYETPAGEVRNFFEGEKCHDIIHPVEAVRVLFHPKGSLYH